mmetsp:Transcript_34775/g.49368  ORF Transcript_34775/g.49368 Transcript_34775/m.49368 type:complete len:153 (+) Transcript_34775:142-600(+)
MWLDVELNQGLSKTLKIEVIPVRPETPMLLSVVYPKSTSCVITINSAWWTPQPQYSCQKQYTQINAVDEVRYPEGIVITFKMEFLRSGNRHILLVILSGSSQGKWDQGDALPRFERAGVLLPKISYGPFLEIQASCGVNCDKQPEKSTLMSA